jgi:thiamine pyrophosphokinase
MKMEACIFLNGEYAECEPLISQVGSDPLVIGVDGGTRHLADFDLEPHIIIGDMDSIPEIELAGFTSQNVQILRYPPEKDETDFELALDQAILSGCREILVFGALGGRSDQMIANILLPVAYLDRATIRLLNGPEEISFIHSQSTIIGKAGDVISLIPISGDVSGVRTSGLRYPLNLETLYLGKSRGVSNELTCAKSTITVSSGVLLCIHTHQVCLGSDKEEER